MLQPHGTFDNRTTMRRERWWNGELKFYVESHPAEGGGRRVVDYQGAFARHEDSEPWGFYPDIPRTTGATHQ